MHGKQCHNLLIPRLLGHIPKCREFYMGLEARKHTFGHVKSVRKWLSEFYVTYAKDDYRANTEFNSAFNAHPKVHFLASWPI